MADDEEPRTKEEGWLDADQPGRPIIAQIKERRGSFWAVVALVLIVAGVVVAQGPKPVPQVRPTASPPPQGLAASVDYVRMTDPQIGWAEVGSDLVRTTDGGGHWNSVTPPTDPTMVGSVMPVLMESVVPAYFLNGAFAWVVARVPSASAGRYSIVVLRTRDGGRTWKPSTAISGPTPPRLSGFFSLDQEHGWMLVAWLRAVEVYRTANGGATWSVALNLPPSVFPIACPNGLSFVNADHGWITGSCTIDLTPVAATSDSGKTWDLWAPAGAAGCACWQPPVFFSDGSGVLPANTGDWMYVTGDRGKTWSARRLPVGASGVSAFIDTRNGWVAPRTAASFYRTRDGGRHWTALSSHPGLASLWQLQFLDDRNGWVLGQAFGGRGGVLFKTADGGDHWAEASVFEPGTSPRSANQVPIRLKAPEGIAVGPDGRVYVADYDGGYVFRVERDGSLVIIAGTGKSGYGGDGGPAIAATFAQPSGLAVDRNGNMFVADFDGQRVRRIDARGIITTTAGGGPAVQGGGSFSGDGGPATAATLSQPLGLAFDRAGALFVGDMHNARVRRIDHGTIASLDAPSLPAPRWIPGYLAFDSAGNLYASDRSGVSAVSFGGGCRIVRLSPAGAVSVVAGTGTCGFSGDGGPAIAAQLDDPNGLAFDSAGNLYVADSNNHRIRRIDRNGIITTVAGIGIAGSFVDSGLGTNAELDAPFGIGIAPGDMLYIADGAGARVRLLDLSVDIITTAAR